MRTVSSDFFVDVEVIAEKCIEPGIDPIKVLSKALLDKNRVDGLVQEALNEES